MCLRALLRAAKLSDTTKIEKFEDLIAWQKARKLTARIYKLTKAGAFARDFGLRDQIQRASVSIMSNIAEGFERAGRAEFHQMLSIAKSSCAEVRSQLYVALDAEYLNQKDFQITMEQAEEVGRIVGGLRALSAPCASMAFPLSPQPSVLSPNSGK